jgi:hypothetical protein
MNQTIDGIIIIAIKLALMVGFTKLIRYWYRKKGGYAPLIVYFALGIILVLYSVSWSLSFILQYYATTNGIAHDDKVLGDSPIQTISMIVGLAAYILIYRKYIKPLR